MPKQYHKPSGENHQHKCRWFILEAYCQFEDTLCEIGRTFLKEHGHRVTSAGFPIDFDKAFDLATEMEIEEDLLRNDRPWLNSAEHIADDLRLHESLQRSIRACKERIGDLNKRLDAAERKNPIAFRTAEMMLEMGIGGRDD